MPMTLARPVPAFPSADADGAGTGATGVRWLLQTSPDERSALDAWCRGVGPVVYRPFAGPEAPPLRALDSLRVIVWNAHVGHGNIDALIADLRGGRLTGAPVEHFVLLLQEVHRAGGGVPAVVADRVAWAGAIRGASAARSEIAGIAARHRLALLYAPSMRNGRAPADGQPADRGNAILSTLPLEAPTLFELPLERQRRVAVIASVRGESSLGSAWSLRLASAHLDHRARLSRLHRSFGSARERQAHALARVLAGGGATALGADLNTWLGGAGAKAAERLRALLPVPATLPHKATMPLPGPIPDLQLDYLFFRVPPSWSAGYRVEECTYGSDHRPLVGWVQFTAAG